MMLLSAWSLYYHTSMMNGNEYGQLRRTASTMLDGGIDVRSLTDSELHVRRAQAWLANQGDDLAKLRREWDRRAQLEGAQLGHVDEER